MRRLLLGLCFAIGLAEPVFADVMAPRIFSEEFARSVAAALPAATVTVARDLELVVRHANGNTAQVNLANAYRDYSQDPKQWERIVRTYLSALAPQNASARLDRTRIVPVIKDRKWLAEMREQFKARDAAQEPVFDNFNSELVVVYAEDRENRTRYLSSSENLGVERSALRALAVANLLRLLPKIERRQHDGAFSMISAGGDYEASLLLFDDIWSSGQIKVDGDIVVAVPAKDVVLVTGSRNRTGLKAVRGMAADLAKGRYGLTNTLFVYRNGPFVKFGRN